MSSDQGNDFISSQINYKQVNGIAPRYKYVKINMSNILSNAIPVSATGVTQVSFKMPYNTVYNLSKSKLVSLVPIPAQGAAVFSRMVAEAFPFGNQSISFETGNGLQLANLSEIARFTKTVTKANTSFRDFITTDTADIPHMSNAATLANNASPLNTSGTTYMLENEYYYTSGANTAKNIPIMYELSNFVHTIFSLDRDVYFGQNDMYLKYTIGPVNTWCFQGDSATNPNSNPATLTNAIGSLQNCYLYLAVECHPIINDNIISEFNSKGLRLLIDYPFVTKTATGASTSQNIVIPFVPAQGKYLKRIYHTIFSGTESLNTALDCENNATNPKVTSYNTYIDSTKLQDDLVACATAPSATLINEDDWRINQPFCRDSVLINYPIYQKSWFTCDDFTNPDVTKDNNGNIQSARMGLPMERGVQYQFLATTANSAFNHVNFAIFTREVSISTDGIQFV